MGYRSHFEEVYHLSASFAISPNEPAAIRIALRLEVRLPGQTCRVLPPREASPPASSIAADATLTRNAVHHYPPFADGEALFHRFRDGGPTSMHSDRSHQTTLPRSVRRHSGT